MLFQGWPPEAWITLLTSLGVNMVAVVQALRRRQLELDENRVAIHKLGWEEARIRGDLIELLRRLLDRGRRRENALATSCEILILAIPKDPSPEMQRAKDRTRELFASVAVPLGEEDGD